MYVESDHEIAGLCSGSHKTASTFQASRRNLFAMLPQNLVKCKIIIRVTTLLPLSSIMWHNHGNEYPVMFTILAYTQEEWNLKCVNSSVDVLGKHFRILSLPVKNYHQGSTYRGESVWVMQADVSSLHLSEGSAGIWIPRKTYSTCNITKM